MLGLLLISQLPDDTGFAGTKNNKWTGVTAKWNGFDSGPADTCICPKEWSDYQNL
ncbi:hypothetical protein SpAn4DRAFT_4570 [Sporomusa ovata]|uniref:Uncharacterized protein n=1 Tax=Sporomusa ovata TaxID=2378 RepID=A0A0U1L692_9FIRM|nr:hypothetical protein [Sporomusa ovata]CQR75206.1 hypothetical protein SpAn4DRAFT_4570 [Sporomusa ovata]